MSIHGGSIEGTISVTHSSKLLILKPKSTAEQCLDLKLWSLRNKREVAVLGGRGVTLTQL